MVTTILKKRPYAVVTAHDGEQALEVARTERPSSPSQAPAILSISGREPSRAVRCM